MEIEVVSSTAWNKQERDDALAAWQTQNSASTDEIRAIKRLMKTQTVPELDKLLYAHILQLDVVAHGVLQRGKIARVQGGSETTAVQLQAPVEYVNIDGETYRENRELLLQRIDVSMHTSSTHAWPSADYNWNAQDLLQRGALAWHWINTMRRADIHRNAEQYTADARTLWLNIKTWSHTDYAELQRWCWQQIADEKTVQALDEFSTTDLPQYSAFPELDDIYNGKIARYWLSDLYNALHILLIHPLDKNLSKIASARALELADARKRHAAHVQALEHMVHESELRAVATRELDDRPVAKQVSKRELQQLELRVVMRHNTRIAQIQDINSAEKLKTFLQQLAASMGMRTNQLQVADGWLRDSKNMPLICEHVLAQYNSKLARRREYFETRDMFLQCEICGEQRKRLVQDISFNEVQQYSNKENVLEIFVYSIISTEAAFANNISEHDVRNYARTITAIIAPHYDKIRVALKRDRTLSSDKLDVQLDIYKTGFVYAALLTAFRNNEIKLKNLTGEQTPARARRYIVSRIDARTRMYNLASLDPGYLLDQINKEFNLSVKFVHQQSTGKINHLILDPRYARLAARWFAKNFKDFNNIAQTMIRAWLPENAVAAAMPKLMNGVFAHVDVSDLDAGLKKLIEYAQRAATGTYPDMSAYDAAQVLAQLHLRFAPMQTLSTRTTRRFTREIDMKFLNLLYGFIGGYHAHAWRNRVCTTCNMKVSEIADVSVQLLQHRIMKEFYNYYENICPKTQLAHEIPCKDCGLREKNAKYFERWRKQFAALTPSRSTQALGISYKSEPVPVREHVQTNKSLIAQCAKLLAGKYNEFKIANILRILGHSSMISWKQLKSDIDIEISESRRVAAAHAYVQEILYLGAVASNPQNLKKLSTLPKIDIARVSITGANAYERLMNLLIALHKQNTEFAEIALQKIIDYEKALSKIDPAKLARARISKDALPQTDFDDDEDTPNETALGVVNNLDFDFDFEEWENID